jgi:hypothetical protein
MIPPIAAGVKPPELGPSSRGHARARSAAVDAYRLHGVNRNSLQNVNPPLAVFDAEGFVMVIYPVPAVVSQARVQLAVDQEARAAPSTIKNDVADLIEVQAEAERELLVDLKA